MVWFPTRIGRNKLPVCADKRADMRKSLFKVCDAKKERGFEGLRSNRGKATPTVMEDGQAESGNVRGYDGYDECDCNGGDPATNDRWD
ncbi:hypothetical protein MKZ38_006745 [Zalerion maritima]|uniref:Uncharacterized protein n=1 Tax=Zalerion maritima TaxID=339359 RepID=A0AAD5RIJ7_9PEZI|nr:hypothetical protein MKZ38_006745 [Zalerion maritima]